MSLKLQVHLVEAGGVRGGGRKLRAFLVSVPTELSDISKSFDPSGSSSLVR